MSVTYRGYSVMSTKLGRPAGWHDNPEAAEAQCRSLNTDPKMADLGPFVIESELHLMLESPEVERVIEANEAKIRVLRLALGI